MREEPRQIDIKCSVEKSRKSLPWLQNFAQIIVIGSFGQHEDSTHLCAYFEDEKKSLNGDFVCAERVKMRHFWRGFEALTIS